MKADMHIVASPRPVWGAIFPVFKSSSLTDWFWNPVKKLISPSFIRTKVENSDEKNMACGMFFVGSNTDNCTDLGKFKDIAKFSHT
jgi:hypothetical protein